MLIAVAIASLFFSTLADKDLACEKSCGIGSNASFNAVSSFI